MSKTKGNLYHYLVLISCCGLICGSLGIPGNATGVFLTPMANDLGVGIGDVSIYRTIMGIASSLSAIAAVGFCQKTGKIRLMLIFSVLLGMTGTIGFSFSKAIWQLNLFGVLVGLANGGMGSAVVSMVINNWFVARRSTFLGFALCFSGISGAIFSPIFSSLIHSFGWRTAYFVNGIALAVVSIPAILFIRQNPQDKGLMSYGFQEEKQNKEKARTASGKKLTNNEKKIIIIVAVIAFLTTAATTIGPNLSNYALSVGFSENQGAYLISASMIGNLSFKLISGGLSDRYGAKKASSIVLVITFISMGALYFGDKMPYAGVFLFSILFGGFYSLAGVLLSALTKDLFGLEKSAQLFSYFSAAGTAGSSLAAIGIGYSFDYFNSYMPSILIIAIFSVIGFVLIHTAFRLKEKKS